MGNNQLEPDLEAGNQPSLLKQSRYVRTGVFQLTPGKEGAVRIDINRKAIMSGTSKAIVFKCGGYAYSMTLTAQWLYRRGQLRRLDTTRARS